MKKISALVTCMSAFVLEMNIDASADEGGQAPVKSIGYQIVDQY